MSLLPQVLSAASDYFAAMFTSSLVEATQEEVALPHVESDSLETLLHYAYTGGGGGGV